MLGLDVGGTTLKGALIDEAGRVEALLRLPTPHPAGQAAMIAAILHALHRLQVALPVGDEVVGAGVVVTGIVDEATGTAVHSENVGWRDSPVRDLLEEALGLPVVVGHDVRAGALAEVRFGAGRGFDDIVYVAAGTGVSAAIVVSGRLVTAGGHAGEIGHVGLGSGAGEVCVCGAQGCVEAVSSAAAIARRYSARTGQPVHGAKEVVQRMEAGDDVAEQVWAQAVDGLATALAWIVGVVAPQVVILGGGLAEAGPRLMEPLRDALDTRLRPPRRPKLLLGELGDRAACRGAALLAWDRLADER